MTSSPVSLYIDLLKKSVLGELYVENELRILYLRGCLEGADQFDHETLLHIRERRTEFAEQYEADRVIGRNYGRSIAALGFQHTMLGRRRLENVEDCLTRVLDDKVPGDVIECGVWRGGTTVFMRGFLRAHGIDDRTVWVADSFEGLPAPSAEQDAGLDLSKERFPQLAISLEEVRDLFRRYGLLDSQVKFLKGWFKDTLATAPIKELSILRLDGDLYESTMDGLTALYPKVSSGGFVIIDDYGALPQCAAAVTDYMNANGIRAEMHRIDWTGYYWRKP